MSARFSLATTFLFAALLVAPLFSPALRADEDPKVFGELGEGIAHARDGDRLLLFLLVENFAPESDDILEAVNEELAGRGHEFAIVRCRHESLDHRKLFEERFEQDPDKMPLGVIATTGGEVVTGTNGKAPEAYRIMIKAARIQGGKEKDPAVIASIEEEIARELEDDDEMLGDTIFGLKKKDVGPKMLLLSEYRNWTFKNGATLEAALLEAKGATGIFVKRDGSKQEVNFNDLSAADKAFLTNLLGGGGN